MYPDTLIAINPLQTFTEAQLKNSGFRLGQFGWSRAGMFILSETSEDLQMGHLVTHNIRKTLSNRTVTYTAGEDNMSFDPGETLTKGLLAGKLLFTGDDNSVSFWGMVKGHGAGVSGTAMQLDLIRANDEKETNATYLKDNVNTNEEDNDIGANAELYFYDNSYVKKAPVAGLDDVPALAGVAPVFVDYSERPIFWRQISGLAPVIVDAAYGVETGLTISDTHAGQALTIGAGETIDDAAYVGSVVIASLAADTLAVVKLRNMG